MLCRNFASLYWCCQQRLLRRIFDQRSCDVRRTPSAVSEAGRVALTAVNVAGLFRTHKMFTARWVQDVFIWCFFDCFWLFLSLSPKDTKIQTKLLHHHQKLVPGEKLVDIACLWFALVPVECTRSCLSCSDLCGKGRRKLTNEAGCAWRECCFWTHSSHLLTLFAKDKAAHSSHWTPDHMRCQVQLSHHVQGTIQGDTKIIHQCWREYAGGRFSMLCTWQAGFDSCNAGTTYMMNAKASLLVDWSKRYVQ